MAQVVVVLGSQSDRPAFDQSGFINILKAVDVTYDVSIISAHRNLSELEEHCAQRDMDEDTIVFVGIAGMSAALAGVMAALVPDRPVIGVPLPSEGYPDAEDALTAVFRMPPGRPVAVCSLANAAILVCQIVATTNRDTRTVLGDYLDEQAEKRPAQISIYRSERSD